MWVESQPAEVPKTVPHLDERTLQAFTREQDARVEQHRKMLDEEAECNAQRLREAVLQQEARVQELAGAHIAKQKFLHTKFVNLLTSLNKLPSKSCVKNDQK